MFNQDLWKQFVRPARTRYSDFELGSQQYINEYGKTVKRIDFKTQNKRNHNLIGGLYINYDNSRFSDSCVIYLHCNTGSRLDIKPYVNKLLNEDFSVCSFDFSGCGNSDGEYITLGYNEKDDINSIIKYLANIGFKNFYLWGRSMGAVAALIYISQKKSEKINGIVLDCPFLSLNKMAIEYGNEITSVPKIFLFPVLAYIKSKIKDKTGFDFENLEIIEYIKLLATKNEKEIPSALFITSYSDKVVLPYHVEQLYQKYPTKKKNLKYINQNHDESRSKNTINDIIKFFSDLKKDYNDELRNSLKNNYISTIRPLSCERKGSKTLAPPTVIYPTFNYNNFGSNSAVNISQININNSIIRTPFNNINNVHARYYEY